MISKNILNWKGGKVLAKKEILGEPELPDSFCGDDADEVKGAMLFTALLSEEAKNQAAEKIDIKQPH